MYFVFMFNLNDDKNRFVVITQCRYMHEVCVCFNERGDDKRHDHTSRMDCCCTLSSRMMQ